MPDWYSDPPLALAVLFIVGGFYVLIKGADLLVEGAVNLAKRQGRPRSSAPPSSLSAPRCPSWW